MGKQQAGADVVHNPEANRFQAEVQGALAVAEYRLGNGRIEFTHTTVPEALKGRGIGSQLAKKALDHARAEGLEVVPTCAFFRSYIQKHSEYQELVAD